MSNIGRPIKIEPSEKMCVKCSIVKPRDSFALSPSKVNPNRRRNDCKLCKQKQTKNRIKKTPNFYQNQYSKMSPEKKAEYINKKSAQNVNRNGAREKRKIYNASDRGIYNRYISDSKRRSRLARGISVELSFEQFSILINSPCTYCGTENSRGIDRLDSSKPYTMENSNPCCRVCNSMKNNLSLSAFEEHINKISNRLAAK